MRNNKGITLLILVITIIIMLIIAGAVVYRVHDVSSANKFNNMRADIKLLNDKILIYYQKYGELPINDKIDATAMKNVLGEQRGPNDSDLYYKIDLTKLENVTLNYGKERKGDARDFYFINSTTFNVYYRKGIRMQGTTYHVGAKYTGSLLPAQPTIAELVKTGTIKRGDYVAYTPEGTSANYTVEGQYASSENSAANQTIIRNSTTNNLNWKVLDVKDNQVILISEEPTTNTIRFHGANGYNNAVKILDDLCDTLYSNPGVGKARSIKIEDLQDRMNLNTQTGGWDYRSYVGVHQYGAMGEKLTQFKAYPNTFYEEEGQLVDEVLHGSWKLSEQKEFKTGVTNTNTSITAKHTYWEKSFVFDDAILEWKDPRHYDLFFLRQERQGMVMVIVSQPIYWIASRGIYTEANIATFYVYSAGGASRSVTPRSMYVSNTNANNDTYPARPIVILNSNVRIDMTVDYESVGGKNISTAWQIVE